MNWFEKIAQSTKQPWEMTCDEYFASGEPMSHAVLPVASLVNLGGTNREERYVRNTARYRDMLERMQRYGFNGNIIDPPPVRLRRTISGGLKIEEGNHRVLAAYDAGIKEIPVEIIEKPFHKEYILQAISEGKDIPPDVAAEYNK